MDKNLIYFVISFELIFLFIALLLNRKISPFKFKQPSLPKHKVKNLKF